MGPIALIRDDWCFRRTNPKQNLDPNFNLNNSKVKLNKLKKLGRIQTKAKGALISLHLNTPVFLWNESVQKFTEARVIVRRSNCAALWLPGEIAQYCSGAILIQLKLLQVVDDGRPPLRYRCPVISVIASNWITEITRGFQYKQHHYMPNLLTSLTVDYTPTIMWLVSKIADRILRLMELPSD